MDKEIKNEFENLSRIVKAGFDGVGKKIEELKKEILEIKADLEDIKLRMGEMVFRFEIKDIEKRLKRLEMKAGLIRR